MFGAHSHLIPDRQEMSIFVPEAQGQGDRAENSLFGSRPEFWVSRFLGVSKEMLATLKRKFST